VIAEKLHAHTMPRARPNTRVKDVPHEDKAGVHVWLDAKNLATAGCELVRPKAHADRFECNDDTGKLRRMLAQVEVS